MLVLKEVSKDLWQIYHVWSFWKWHERKSYCHLSRHHINKTLHKRFWTQRMYYKIKDPVNWDDHRSNLKVLSHINTILSASSDQRFNYELTWDVVNILLCTKNLKSLWKIVFIFVVFPQKKLYRFNDTCRILCGSGYIYTKQFNNYSVFKKKKLQSRPVTLYAMQMVI